DRVRLVRSLTGRRMRMVRRPDDMNAFEFAVVAGLRAAQLHRGCTPRVDGSPKLAVTAQHEVAKRKVVDPTRGASVVIGERRRPALERP
ncbi:MAG TPA: hypothetical protein VNA65_07995, partial [Candidatus Dormibacteraeota bacterium]|nr:hypothetical protein [Candidatus Dormibacteraeota bacterium]